MEPSRRDNMSPPHLSIFLILLSYNHYVNSYIKSDYAGVLTEIFTTNSYDKKVLPMEESGHPLMVDLTFFLMGFNEIDEVSEKMTTTAFLFISWIDKGLTWTPASHNDTEYVYIPQDDIWKPDISLQNGFKKFSELGGSFYQIKVNYDGFAAWLPFELFESRCSLDTTYYPFDKQRCDIILVIWSYSSMEVDIMKSEEAFQYDHTFHENSVWDIVSVTYHVSRESREATVIYTFDLKRKPLYYVMNIILPIVLLGFLSGLVFVIPADTGEKTGYSVTVFLSLAVFLTIISAVLPVNSEKVSIFGIYILLQVVLSVVALIASTVQLRLNARSDSKPVTGIALKLTRLIHKGCCRKKSKVSNLSDVDIIDADQVKDFTCAFQTGPDGHGYTWKDVVTAIDFYGFWLFFSLYIVLTVLLFVVLTV